MRNGIIPVSGAGVINESSKPLAIINIREPAVNKTIACVVMLLAGLMMGAQAWAEDAQPVTGDVAEYELDSWTSAKEINTVEAYEVYLAEYASGRHAKYARAAINKIRKNELVLDSAQAGTQPAKENVPAVAKVSTAPIAAEQKSAAGMAEDKIPAPVSQPTLPNSSSPNAGNHASGSPEAGENAKAQ